MRIGFVIYGSLDTLTGGYLYDRKLVEHLRACGDEVEVVSLPWRSYGRHLADNASRSFAARLAGEPFDVLLQDELNHPSLVLTNRRLKRRVAYPIVSVVHHLRADELADSSLAPLYAAVERRYLASLDAAVFNSTATRARAETLVGRPLRGVVAHPCADHLGPGLPESDVARRARDGGPLRIVSVANVAPRKGLHVLVEALRQVPPEQWRLTVAGSLTVDRSYVRRLRRAIADAGMNANVELLGQVPDPELRALLARSDVLAVPSSLEGFGIAYLEGMRYGLAIIASSAGGAGEVVEHGREGFLVAPGDAQSLAAHLGRLAADRALLARSCVAARRKIASHPAWQDSFRPARELLRSIASDDPKPESSDTRPRDVVL
jgi:glycosyltransferase involved in cell wall biosynthesis